MSVNGSGKDPLHSAQFVPDRTRELFDALSKCASGFSASEVAGAAINLLLNAIRQSHSTRDRAAKAFDEHAGRAKYLLLEKHYHNDGSRRNIFPFAQHLTVEELHVESPSFMGKKTTVR